MARVGLDHPVTTLGQRDEVARNVVAEIRAAVAEEREACAKLVDAMFQEPRVVHWDEYGKAIRARGSADA